MLKRSLVLALVLAAGTTHAQTVLLTTSTTIGPTDTTINGVPLSSADIIVQGATLTVNGPHAIHSLVVERNALNAPGIVTHTAGTTFTDGLGAETNGVALTIATDCTIQGADVGLVASRIDLVGRGFGAGQGPGSNALNSGGQAGASHAGRGGLGNTFDSAASYGSFDAPVMFGSGAPRDCSTGASGGGCIKLVVGGTLLVNGTISANANATGACGSGGAAGGSIWIQAGTFAGAGTLSANGGPSNRSDSGGGGGGRISVSYTSSTFVGAAQAYGGAEPAANVVRRAGAGTVWMKPAATRGVLTLDNGGFVGTTTDISGEVVVNGDVVVRGGALIGHGAGEAGARLTVVGDMTTEPSSGINVDARGFAFGQGPGSFPTVAGGNRGAGYGGRGGDGLTSLGGLCYGSVETPTDLGSGGPPDCGSAGRGGGAFQLTVGGTLVNNGVITASGGTRGGTCGSGGASGGSILIETSELLGNGLIAANGADGNRTDAGGGGGGRVAVHYETSSYTGAITAYGGNAANATNQVRRAGAGTVWLQPGSGLATLIVDNGGFAGQRTDFAGDQTFAANLVVDNEGSISHPMTTPDTHLTFLGDVLIAQDANISVNGRGYPGGQGPGSRATNGGGMLGAGHGGRGGDGSVYEGGLCYGSVTQPSTFGSGGGLDCNAAGYGGGALWLSVGGTLTVEGRISSNGDQYTAACGSGGAAGGSLLIETGTLAGSGVISANGSNSSRGDAGGGGGGRIAVYYDTWAFAGGVQAFGATSGGVPSTNRRAGAGTIWLQPSSGLASMVIDNNGNRFQSTDFTGATVWPANLIVKSGGVVSHPGASEHTTLEFTGDVDIQSGGAVSVTGRGYAPGQGPGSNARITPGQGGAGYGGRGGNGTVVTGGAIYGSESSPTDLGSGGGRDCSAGVAGGGALRLIVGGELRVDGELSADGGTLGAACGSSGASGGSLWVEASSLVGSGRVSADGSASNRSDSGSGGGGRVAIYSCDVSMPLANIHASAGAGPRPGQSGTLLFGTNSVTIVQQPVDVTYIGGVTVELEVSATTSQPSHTLTYQWRRRQDLGEYVPLIEGQDNRFFGVDTPILSITPIECVDGGYFDCLVTDACGSFPTDGAFVQIQGAADYDHSGGVDGDDVIAFFADWDVSNEAADFNNDGGVDGDDVIAFFGRWDASC